METEFDLKYLIDDLKTNHHDYMICEMQSMRRTLHELEGMYLEQDERVFEITKRFERFSRDLIQHMDDEETFLFPWILSQIGRSTVVPTIEIDSETLEQLAAEDRVIEFEFAKVVELANHLANGQKTMAKSYTEVYQRLLKIQENIAVHAFKERHFILPFIEQRLRSELSEKVTTR